MDNQLSFQSIINTVANGTSAILDTVAELFLGGAETLRDGTEFHPVDLPRDLAAHRGAQTEWWYYTGHITTTAGNRLGFEIVFFKRRTDLDRFAVVPLRLFGNPLYFAHFALTDLDGRTFRYAHRKSSNGRLEAAATASEKHLYINLGDWSLREANGSHLLRATIGSDTFEATLKPAKPVVLNGENGVSLKDTGQASRYFSYTRMEVEGDLVRNGVVEHFTGSAWMDREFGTWAPTENQKGWDWFSVQLNDNTELMCYQLRTAAGEISPYSSGTFVYSDGRYERLSNEDFSITPQSTWTSPGSGAEYPSGWALEVPKLDLSLNVTPVLNGQELDTRGTTMIVYWEGACEVIGTKAGSMIDGNAYVELVGYDRSHEQPNLAYFLMGDSLDFLRKFVP